MGLVGSFTLLARTGLLAPLRPLLRSGRNSSKLGLGNSDILGRPASEDGETSEPRLKKEDPELGLKRDLAIREHPHSLPLWLTTNLMMGGTKPAAFSW